MAVVRDIDRGYRRILREFTQIGERQVLAGVRSKDGVEVPEGSDLNLAQIAAVNEFGSEDPPDHPPERSFLRSTVDVHQREYAALVEEIIGAAIDGRQKLDKGLGLLGARLVADIQQTMRNFDDPANAPSTIARKGFDNPLIETGRLRQSIDWEIRKVGPVQAVAA